MSVNVTLNGTVYTIPQTSEKGWGTQVTSWIQSVSSNTLQKTGGAFTLSAEVDFGGAFGLKALYVNPQTIKFTDQGSSPAAPAAGSTLIYTKVDGKLYKQLSTGVESEVGSATTNRGPYNKTNYGMTFGVAANAATIALKGADGNDPSGANIVELVYKHSTNATGLPITRTVQAALSIVIPSTATLGQQNNIAAWIYVYALDNSGTIKLCVSGSPFSTQDLQTTTLLAAASNSATLLYSDAVYTNMPIRYLGKWLNSQATAGTWVSAATQAFLESQDLMARSYTELQRTANSSQASATADTFYVLDAGVTVTAPRTAKYRIGIKGVMDASSVSTGWIIIGGQFSTSSTPNTSLIGNPFGLMQAGAATSGSTFGGIYYESEPIYLASGQQVFVNTRWHQQSGGPSTVNLEIAASASYPFTIFLTQFID